MAFVSGIYGFYWVKDDPSRLAPDPAAQPKLVERVEGSAVHGGVGTHAASPSAGGAVAGESAEEAEQAVVVAQRRSADLQGEVGTRDQTAAEHEVGGAADRAAAAPVVDAPDLAVGQHRRVHGLAHARDPFPVRRRTVTVDLGARVHDQPRRTAVGQRPGAVERTTGVVVTQPHLRRHRDRGRHRSAHRAQNAVQQFGFA